MTCYMSRVILILSQFYPIVGRTIFVTRSFFRTSLRSQRWIFRIRKQDDQRLRSGDAALDRYGRPTNISAIRL